MLTWMSIYIPWQVSILVTGNNCSVCGITEGTIKYSECNNMLLCSNCNDFWHCKNPTRCHHVTVNISQSVTDFRDETGPTTSAESESYEPSLENQQHDSGYLESTFEFETETVKSREPNIEDMCRVASLAENFGLTSFKQYQMEVIDRCLKGKDCLVVQPTGSGKSLCYQFAAVYSGKMAIVISPTISLMVDQVAKLTAKGIEAAYLGSSQPDKTLERKIFEGKTKVAVLFVTPEWMFSSNKMSMIKEMAARKQLSLLAIDEAHLAFEWKTFRSQYSSVDTIKREFPNLSLVLLTATATPALMSQLKALLVDPFVCSSSMNRPNVKYFVEKLPSRGRLSAENRGDFTTFAERVKDIVADECSIVYTDFVVDVGPILCALRGEGLSCAAYYGEMDPQERKEAYTEWMNGNVQIMVATEAFGLGIDKSDIRHIVRNGVPESIAAWMQESGRAGRDGAPSSAHILYTDGDIDHAGAWIQGHIQNPSIREEILSRFSESWKFVHAHLAGKCRRQVVVEAFGEPEVNAIGLDGECCDVCDQNLQEFSDHKHELAVAIDAIHTLGVYREAKLSLWIRGNTRPWMEPFNKTAMSFANSLGHSEQWWCTFFRQAHVHGLLDRKIANLAKANQHYAVQTLYYATEAGENSVINGSSFLLPILTTETKCIPPYVSKSRQPCSVKNLCCVSTSRTAKGGRIIDRVKELLVAKENWKVIQSSKDHLYPGCLREVALQYMLFIPDIGELKPSQSKGIIADDFLWKDIQFSKGKGNIPRIIETCIDGKSEKVLYRIAPCGGVKICPSEGCSYTVALKEHHRCPLHNQPLQKQGGCPVYFVYVEPEMKGDKRRWMAGLVIHNKVPTANLHNHAMPPQSSLLTSTVMCLQDAQRRLPTLSAHEASQGIGTGYCIGLSDTAANNLDRVRYQLAKVRGPKEDITKVLQDFEAINR